MRYQAFEMPDGTWEVVTHFGGHVADAPLHLTKEQAELAVTLAQMAHSHGKLSAKEELRNWLGAAHG